MSGPNTLNPWGTTQKTALITSAVPVKLFDLANLRGTNWAWKTSILSLQISQLVGGPFQLQDENGNVFLGPYEGVVGTLLRAFDYPSQTTPGANHSIYAACPGASTVEVAVELQGYQEPVS